MSKETDKQFVEAVQKFRAEPCGERGLSATNDLLCDLPEELFDGWAVAKQVREATGKEFTAENISAVLDAVVFLMKKRLRT